LSYERNRTRIMRLRRARASPDLDWSGGHGNRLEGHQKRHGAPAGTRTSDRLQR